MANQRASSRGFRCDRKDTSGTCFFSVRTVSNYQAFEGRVTAHIEGHGSFGGAGGVGAISACLSPNGAMWSGSCWNLYNRQVGDGRDDVDEFIANYDWTTDFKFIVADFYANDATWDPIDLWVNGRVVRIDNMYASTTNVLVGQSFSVFWSVSDSVIVRVYPLTSNISCDSSYGQQVDPSGPNANTSCTANSAGIAEVSIVADGPSAYGPIYDGDRVRITVNPLPPPTCSPSSQSVKVGETANFSATAGDGNYSWSAPGGSSLSGTGGSFSTSYSTTGTKTVTVTSASQSASCTVNVSTPPLLCGNKVPDPDEACDDGINNGTCPRTCSSACTINDCSTPTPGPTPTPTPTPSPGACVEDHKYESVSIPGSITLSPSQQYSFNVVNKNTGQTWWYHGSLFQFVQLPEASPPFVLNPSYGHLSPSMRSGDTQQEDFILTAPSSPGTYTFQMRMVHRAGADYLLDNGSVCAPAPSQDVYFGEILNVAVNVSGLPQVVLTALPDTVNSGGNVTVSWSGVISPTTTDLIALYHPGDPDSPFFSEPDFWDYFYTSSCTKTPGNTARASGACLVPMPSTLAVYEFRLFSGSP